MKKTKVVKDSSMNIRLTKEQKKRYEEEAKKCNMKLSEYVIHLLENKKVTMIENGEKIAHAMYDLNETLNKCIKYPNIPLTKTREAISENIRMLNESFGGR